MTSTVAARLPNEDIREIEKYAKEENMDKSTFLKNLLYKSLEEYRIKRAFRLYKEKKISLGKVGEIANVSMWKVFDLMSKHNVTLSYGIEEFKEDIDGLDK